MTIVKKCWANDFFFSYESCNMSIKPIHVVRKFHNPPPLTSSITPVFGTRQYFSYFISNNYTKSKVRSLNKGTYHSLS